MSQCPLISIIVPVYNVEGLIKKCIDSLIIQTYKTIEIILVDDGSTDDSPAICDDYMALDSRITVVHKKNGGLSSARNAGLRVSRGDYIGFVDSDDYIDENMYLNLLREIIKGKDNCIAQIGMTLENDIGVIKNQRIEEGTISNYEYLKSLLLHKGDVSVNSKLFPRKVITGHFFDETRLNEDLIFMVEILNNFSEIRRVNEVGYHYVSRYGSISRSFGKAVHDMVVNAKEIRKIVDERYPSYSEVAERFELFQNIAFLCACPFDYNRASDPQCGVSVSFLRKNYFRAIRNRYLKAKDKIRLTLICISPRMMSLIVEFSQKQKKKV